MKGKHLYIITKSRVAAYNTRLANKVLSLGKTRGIGYDIQSVIAEPGDEAEFVKYIEVKSTKRLTSPDLSDPLWVDSLNITRNEWIAAQHIRVLCNIQSVFYTRGGYCFCDK
ncbi:MAG: protein NO VEIN domain-containing protein [Blautia marasmi]